MKTKFRNKQYFGQFIIGSSIVVIGSGVLITSDLEATGNLVAGFFMVAIGAVVLLTSKSCMRE